MNLFKLSPWLNSTTTVAALLAYSYMKTFDNPDTGDFLKAIKDFNSNNNDWEFNLSNIDRDTLLHYSLNQPIIELIIGEEITEENEVCLLLTLSGSVFDKSRPSYFLDNFFLDNLQNPNFIDYIPLAYF